MYQMKLWASLITWFCPDKGCFLGEVKTWSFNSIISTLQFSCCLVNCSFVRLKPFLTAFCVFSELHLEFIWIFFHFSNMVIATQIFQYSCRKCYILLLVLQMQITRKFLGNICVLCVKQCNFKIKLLPYFFTLKSFIKPFYPQQVRY